MAICLRRSLRSGASFVFVIRRNQQTSCFDQRLTSNVPVPLLKEEVTRCDFKPFSLPRNCNYSLNVVSSLQIYLENPLLWQGLNYISFSRHHTLDGEKNIKLSYLRLDDDTVFCAEKCNAYKEKVLKDFDNDPGRPEPDQVQYVFKILSEDLPKIFTKSMNYKIYHPNIIFENNIRGTKTRGVASYSKQIMLLKTIGYLKYAYINFDILKITAHPEDGTVRVRWRIRGIPSYKVFFSFLWFFSSTQTPSEGWYDGFSVFYVRSDGLVHKHIVDKMMPDSEGKVGARGNHLAPKMAFAMGVLNKDNFTSFKFA